MFLSVIYAFYLNYSFEKESGEGLGLMGDGKEQENEMSG